MTLWTAIMSLGLAQTSGGDLPSLNGQLYRPPVDATRTLWADDSGLQPDGSPAERWCLAT
jgi:hypothetical protein